MNSVTALPYKIFTFALYIRIRCAMRIKKNVAVSDTGFVFNPTTGDSYSINQVGQEIIRYLAADRSIDEITSLMTSEYDIDPSSFEKYLFDFLSMLRQFELLEEEHAN